jgi:hypothetical protein
MKPLRLLALAIAATAWCASAAFACDGSKTSAANASSCGTKSSSVKSASATSCGTKSTATATVASSSKAGGCAMSAEACKAMMASGACTAEMQAACAANGGKGVRTASAGNCSMHATAAHADCAVCADEMACDDDVKSTGARAQVVPLRNGTMIVYMLDSGENVRGLQAAVARHNNRVVAALQGDAKLCTACKKLRGALASGKLVREVVNVERGCQLLITSSDRSIVQQVHACTSAQVASRTKS